MASLLMLKEDSVEEQQSSPEIYAPTVYNIKVDSVDHFHPGIKITSNSKAAPTQDDADDCPLVRKRGFTRRIAKVSRCTIGDSTLGLKRKLQEFYQEATLPCVAWLDKGKDLLMRDYYAELQLDSSDTLIPVEKIFDKVSKKSPRRILIEGQPGYGKTTLATKIVHDWALHKNYIKYFKLTFMVSLRELQQRNIKDAIQTIAKHCGFKRMDKLFGIIEDNMSHTLLLLDGLDELPVNDRLAVLKLLYKQVYGKMTVIVTCRTGLFTLEHEELNLLFGAISKKKVFYDKRIRVLGIGIEDRRKFIQKFIPDNNADDVINQIEKLTKSVVDMFKSPLFLILLVFIASKKNDLTTLATKTQLFRSLFNCIIRRSLTNNGLEDEVDLFKFSEETFELQRTIQQFGKLSLKHILKNNMQFECSETTMQIYNMGFLINHKEISYFQSNSHYEAFHLSILEFAAAFSIWMDFKQHSFGLPGQCLQCIQPLYFRLGKTSLILTFLAGLLQDEAYEFFQQVSSFAHMFSASEDSLWHLLTECQENNRADKLLPSLKNFIPPHIHQWNEIFTSFHSSDFYDNLVQFGVENDRIKQIYINNVYPTRIPQNIVIPRLWVEIQPEISHQKQQTLKSKGIVSSNSKSPYFRNLETTLKNIQCRTLIYRFNSGFTEAQGEAAVWNYLCLLETIKKVSCSLCMDGFAVYKTMHEHINHPIVQNMHFGNLRMHVGNSMEKELLMTLIQRNQIETLQLLMAYYSPVSKPNEVVLEVANSSNLHSFHLIGNDNNNLLVDLYDLTKGGTKEYSSLTIKDSSIICRRILSNKNCIHALILKALTNEEKTNSLQGLSMIDPTVLECNSCLFEKLPLTWSGFASLKELALPMDESSNKALFWKHLSLCKNLKMLELIFPVRGNVYVGLPIEEIVLCLQQLPIERLAIRRVKAQYGVTKKIIQCIAGSLPWRFKPKYNMGKRFAKSIVDSLQRNSAGQLIPHPLKTIDLISMLTGEDVEQLDNLCSIINDLLTCLKMYYLKSVNIICGNISLWHSLMQKNIIDHTVFSVSHMIHGSTDDEPDYYKLLYNGFSIFSYDTFCISLKNGNF